VVVVTGNPGQEITERCEGFDASCIHKGNNFWNDFEARLAEIYPQSAAAIKQSGQRSAKIEVRERPRVLLVDDDISVKKFFFKKFEKLGAELLYAVDGNRGFGQVVGARSRPSSSPITVCRMAMQNIS
jgi:hypothetical protein